jgi:RimJ/RimL family protein N-acetyltransferase
MEPTDAARLERFHSRLSERTTFLRYFSPHPRLSPQEVARFTRVDHHDREAMVATDGEEIVGVARFDRVGGTGRRAEVAVVVEDAWQGRGVGTALLEVLADRASEEGVDELFAETLAENTRMRRVFSRLGWATAGFDQGVAELVLPLTEE